MYRYVIILKLRNIRGTKVIFCFMFFVIIFLLCLFQKCFDHKPRMISKRNKDNSTSCSHPVTKHEFEKNKYVDSF